MKFLQIKILCDKLEKIMTYKDIAYKILKSEKKPLHSKKITQIAIKKGWLKPKGLTPEATMNAQLIRDIHSKKTQSRFIQTAPSTFAVNTKYKKPKTVSVSRERKPMSERFVKNSIIKYLSRNGWGNFDYGEKHEKGVDIKASRHRFSEHFWIEAKGKGKTPQIDYSYFYYSLGQIVTRMNKINKTTKYKFGLGLPEAITKIALRRLPWQLAKKLNLHILSVNQDGKVTSHSWKKIKDHIPSKARSNS